MNTINYVVPSMHCMHCVHTIKTELAELPGVKNVDVSLDSKDVKVEYDLPASPLAIEQLLAEINYPVQK